MNGSEPVTVTGLLGIYEDCIASLSNPDQVDGLSSATFLWMGNSIVNFDHFSEAGSLLSRFRKACKLSKSRCQFLVSSDICQLLDKVAETYNPELGEFRDFISNRMSHANSALGYNAFRFEDWSCETKLCPERHTLQVYYTSRRDVQITVSDDGSSIPFTKGQKVRIITAVNGARLSSTR